MYAYVGVCLILVCFGAFHDLTGREVIREWIRSKLGLGIATYAMLRSFISLALLVLSLVLLFRWTPTTVRLFRPILGLFAIVPTMFAFWIAGMALGQVAKSRRLPQFFGVREYPKVFYYSGAYSICRHPMYAGWLIASWGIVLSRPYLLTVVYNGLLTIYVLYEALQEEKKMIELFGDRYIEYRKRVPFIIPYGFLKTPQK